MTDLSLHVKYRPGTFDDFYGNDDVVNSVIDTLKNKRSRAYLFTGPSGCGKTTLARIVANEICEGEAKETNVIEIDAADKTGVESIRELKQSLYYKAIGGKPFKIIIMDECHMLSKSSWNNLLKAIEEPPAHVYWIFCTTEPSKVPDTIKTRCLKYDLRPLDEDQILKLIKFVSKKEEYDTRLDILEHISELSNGSPRQALVFLEACKYCESAAEALNVIKAAGAANKEVVDLCRLLVSKQGRDWTRTVKIVNDLKAIEPESIRISIVNYFSSVLMNTKSQKEAMRILDLMECFDTPYNQSDRFAPLLLSLGRALYLKD